MKLEGDTAFQSIKSIRVFSKITLGSIKIIILFGDSWETRLRGKDYIKKPAKIQSLKKTLFQQLFDISQNYNVENSLKKSKPTCIQNCQTFNLNAIKFSGTSI